MNFALSSWIMWATHHQSTLTIAMNCTNHGAVLLVFGSCIGTHHGQHHIIILECWQQQQLQISWILCTPTPWQLTARLLGASWV